MQAILDQYYSFIGIPKKSQKKMKKASGQMKLKI